MNERQIKAVEKLESNNENYIKELEKIHKEMLEGYKEYDSFEKEFWEQMNKMEKSHSQIYFKPYSDAYCVKNGVFSMGKLIKNLSFLPQKEMKIYTIILKVLLMS